MIYVDIQFPLKGDIIPVDHGYPLYSTVSKIIPELHDNKKFGLHPISGTFIGNRCQRLTARSHLTVRLPSDSISIVLPLAGKELTIENHLVRVGVPKTRALVSSAFLYSRLVIIKGFVEPEPFLEAAARQLESLGINGKPSLVEQPHVADFNVGKERGSHSPVLRRTIRIRDKEVVGFALRVEKLSPEESIRLQEKGIGGRRRFGCGIFIPDRR